MISVKKHLNTKHNLVYKIKSRSTYIQAVLLVCCLTAPALAYYDAGKIKIKSYGKMKLSFDDNITFNKDNKKEDIIVASSLGLNVNYEGKKQSLTMNSVIDHNTFLKNTALTNTSQQAKLNYLYYISRYSTLMLQDTYIHAHSPLTLEGDFGKDIGRYGYRQNDLYLNYVRDISKHLSIYGIYRNIYYRTAKDNANNSLIHNIGIGVDYLINSAITLKFKYGFGVSNFSIDGTSLTHTVTAGLRRFITNQLYIDITAGASTVKPVYGKTTTNANITAAVTDEITKTDTITLVYNKTTLPSVFSYIPH